MRTAGAVSLRTSIGDERNLMWSEIEAAADANGMSPEQAVANMQQMAQQRS